MQWPRPPLPLLACIFLFFFNDTATTEIYTLSLHDALPISDAHAAGAKHLEDAVVPQPPQFVGDRKSTRLNSSHSQISYAVFCLKKNNNKPSASGRSPLLVSSAIVVVITRVTPSMFPPTIMTAPTSAAARPIFFF